MPSVNPNPTRARRSQAAEPGLTAEQKPDLAMAAAEKKGAAPAPDSSKPAKRARVAAKPEVATKPTEAMAAPTAVARSTTLAVPTPDPDSLPRPQAKTPVADPTSLMSAPKKSAPPLVKPSPKPAPAAKARLKSAAAPPPPAVVSNVVPFVPSAPRPKPAAAVKGLAKTVALPATAPGTVPQPESEAQAPPPAEEDVLLGHVISRCVGIQHYHNNGQRYSKEPLRLRREPNNRYDRNAVGTYTIPGGAQVGHVQRIDALSVAIVADSLPIKMVGTIESGATQVYKFPLRISFFGPARLQPQVAALLYRGGSRLVPAPLPPLPLKARAPNAPAQSSGTARPALGLSAAGGSVPATAKGDDDDELVFGETVTWAQRDAALRAQAVVLV